RAQSLSGVTPTPLADHLFLLTGAGSNVIAQTGSRGVLMVDGGSAEHANILAQAVSALPGAGPVHTLINTHWHPEQTGSNLSLGRAGAAIIAHENTRLWLRKEIQRPWEDLAHQSLAKEAHPNQTFQNRNSLTLNGAALELGHLPEAHTSGDIFVFF